MRLALVLVALLAGCIDGDQMHEREEQSPPIAPAQGDFAAFIACIELEDFVAANMAGAWSQIATDGAAACTSCHTADGMFSGDAQRFFEDLKHRTYVQVQFFTFDRTTSIVDVNTETIPAIGKAIAPYAEHPRFNATKGLDATFALYDRTIARLAAGNCR